MEEENKSARVRAKRDYMISGAVALAAAVLGIASEGSLSGVPLWLVAVAVGLAAVLYARMARRFLHREDGDAGPSIERMRRMVVIWSILTAVLGIAMLRAPVLAFRGGGATGLAARDFSAGAAGIGALVAACVFGIRSVVASRGGR